MLSKSLERRIISIKRQHLSITDRTAIRSHPRQTKTPQQGGCFKAWCVTQLKAVAAPVPAPFAAHTANPMYVACHALCAVVTGSPICPACSKVRDGIGFADVVSPRALIANLSGSQNATGRQPRCLSQQCRIRCLWAGPVPKSRPRLNNKRTLEELSFELVSTFGTDTIRL